MFDWIFEIRDWYRGTIVELFRSLGIHPVYGPTIIMIILLLSNYKYFKEWEEQPKHMKSYLKSFIFATSVLDIGSILNLFTGFLEPV